MSKLNHRDVLEKVGIVSSIGLIAQHIELKYIPWKHSMENDISIQEQASFEAIDDQMSEDRAALLAAVARVTEDDGDGIPTGQLREAVGIPSGSMPYHMGALTEWEVSQ